MHSITAKSVRAAVLFGGLVLGAIPALAQRAAGGVRPVSLEDAIQLAEQRSTTVRMARAGVTRAEGQFDQARSQFLPQVGASLGYTRTLRSQFSGFSFGSTSSDSTGSNGTSSPASNLQSVGFGAENEYVIGLQVSQNVFTWGRLTGQRTAAVAGQRVADLELGSQRAQLALDVTQAYYDAVLAQQLLVISDSTLAQTDELLRQTTVARRVGNASDFDLLKAQVTRDNQRPQVLQAETNLEVALLNLKRLLELPLDDSVVLTTPIENAPMPGLAGIATTNAPDTSSLQRAAVREAQQNVRAQEGLLQVARAERYPALSLTSGYQRLFFPANTFPAWSNFRENWTVGLSAQVSLFNGGGTHGDELVAQANVHQAQAQLDQTRQYAAVDARVAMRQLAQADASWEASAGTSEQARRAYAIDQVRYQQGLSTQTDLAQSRLLLQQAEANRAQAARDLAVARVRVALLRDLPLSGGPGGASSGSSTTSTGASASRMPASTPAVTGTSGQIGGNTP